MSLSILAQDKEPVNVEADSVEVEEKKPFAKELAGYIEQSWVRSPYYNGVEILPQVGVGLFYEGFNIGFFVLSSGGQIKDDPFFPEDYYLPFNQTGIFLGKSLYRGQKIQVYTRINVSYGEMLWKNKEDGETIHDDHFSVVKPEIQLSYLPLPFIQIFASTGYKQTYNFGLTQVNPSSYEGLAIDIGIRLGYFYKPKQE